MVLGECSLYSLPLEAFTSSINIYALKLIYVEILISHVKETKPDQDVKITPFAKLTRLLYQQQFNVAIH